MPHPRYTRQEIVRMGEELYRRQIQAQVESAHAGEFLVLDVETGDYEIDADDLLALDRAKAKNSEAPYYIVRVGFPTAVNLGGRFP